LKTTSPGSYLIRLEKRLSSRRHLLCAKCRHDPSR